MTLAQFRQAYPGRDVNDFMTWGNTMSMSDAFPSTSSTNVNGGLETSTPSYNLFGGNTYTDDLTGKVMNNNAFGDPTVAGAGDFNNFADYRAATMINDPSATFGSTTDSKTGLITKGTYMNEKEFNDSNKGLGAMDYANIGLGVGQLAASYDAQKESERMARKNYGLKKDELDVRKADIGWKADTGLGGNGLGTTARSRTIDAMSRAV